MLQDEPGTLDRRALLRRMAVGGAVLWAAPSFHSVASAQALPSCGPGVLDWDDLATNTAFSSTVVNGTTVAMTITDVVNTTLLAENGRVRPGPAGGIYEKYLRFDMTPANGTTDNGSRQTITFSFSNPVSLVQFSFFDIDNTSSGFFFPTGWGDRIVMNTPGYLHSAPPGSTVVGTGTNGDRFRNTQANNNLADTSGAGNLLITYNGPISQFSFTYRNEGRSGAGNQQIGLSDIAFLC